MPESYPIPSHAASFWIAGDDLWIAFPPQGPEARGSSIHLPANEHGLATAIAILKSRTLSQDLRLGNRGTPTQHALETDKKYNAWLRAMNEDKEETATERAKAKAELEEIGL